MLVNYSVVSCMDKESLTPTRQCKVLLDESLFNPLTQELISNSP